MGVVPLRARSKSLAARSRAAGGREDGSGEVEGGWTAEESVVGAGFEADEAADWP